MWLFWRKTKCSTPVFCVRFYSVQSWPKNGYFYPGDILPQSIHLYFWFESHSISLIIIQAKKFLKGDWLKRVVFQRNLKYLHVVFHFHGNQGSCVLILKTWQKGFLNAWMPFTLIPSTLIPSQCPHFTVKSSPYPLGFGCIIYCLAMSCQDSTIHEWHWRLCKWTHVYTYMYV